MYPYLNVFGHDIGTYSICAVVGLIFAALYVWLNSRKKECYDSVQIINVAVVAGLGVFLGAHILYAVTRWKVFILIFSKADEIFSSFDSLIAYLAAVFGGMVFYGGLIGGLIAGVIYIKRLKHIKLDPLDYADMYAPAIPLFHAFGRIGCFLGGCCYGIECTWGFVYHSAPVPDANGVTRLPIQLIESVGDIVIFIILHLMSRKKLKKGTLISTYLILYPIIRFVNEFFRGDVIRGFFLGLSTSQWVSIILIICSVGFLIRRNLKKEDIKEAPAEEQHS